MSSSFQPSPQENLKRFNLRFPKFYEQFVSSEIQWENYKLAHKLVQTREAVICTDQEGEKTAIHFAALNQPSLLRDVFGVLAAYNLTAHNLSIHGQIKPPMPIFMRLTVTRGGKPLTSKTQGNICRALREALEGRFEVEEMLSVERFEDDYLEDVRTEFYIDQVFHLPALLVEGNTQEGVFYKIANAIAPENLLVVNANLIVRQGRTRLLLYVLNRYASSIPDYLGHKLADRVKQRLTQPA